jgi:hypothetical protein
VMKVDLGLNYAIPLSGSCLGGVSMSIISRSSVQKLTLISPRARKPKSGQ